MATQPKDDELELTPDMELDDGQDQDDQGGASDDDREVGDGDGEQGAGDGPASVGFADEEPNQDQPGDTSTIRAFRQREREKDRRIAELERQVAPKPIDVGEKPTMADCGFDEDEFEARLDEWKERKAAADQRTAKQAEDNQKINEAWQADLATFEQKKGRLEFEDRDEAINAVQSSLDLVQQAVIVKAAVDPALFLYALSKSEAKRDELARIHDPIKMAAAVARMEGAVKVTKGRKAPDPDRAQTGSSAMPGGSDKQLEKLEKEADRTGDRTKLLEYKAKLKDRAKAKA